MWALSRYITVFLLIVFISSCRIGNNDDVFVKSKIINDVKYELHRVPKSVFETSDKDSIYAADLAYYKLIISGSTGNSKIDEMYKQSNYNKLLYYVNSGMAEDLISYYDNKESKPVQVYFETNNRMSKKMVFLLAYEKQKESDKTFLFSFNDKIFNNGPVKFQFNLEDLKTL